MAPYRRTNLSLSLSFTVPIHKTVSERRPLVWGVLRRSRPGRGALAAVADKTGGPPPLTATSAGPPEPQAAGGHPSYA
jgi:hypothetical protein